jgi:hypothetical protein
MKNYNDIIKNYPLLFLDEKTTHTVTFECEIGWYDIIEAACACLYFNYEAAATSLKYYSNILENVDEEFNKRLRYRHRPESKESFIKECEDKKAEYIGIVEKIKGNLPRFTQIKEKFGALRMYYDGGDDCAEAIVNFVELLSYSICESCGSIGSLNEGPVITIRCEPCRLKSSSKSVTDMSTSDVIQLLSSHNKWRRGDDSLEMTNPKLLGEVLDIACKKLEKLRELESTQLN